MEREGEAALLGEGLFDRGTSSDYLYHEAFFYGSYVLRLLLITTPTQHFGKGGRKSNGLCILFHEIVVSFSLRVNLMSWEYKREGDDDCFETVVVGRIVYRCILNTHVLYP